MTTYWFKEILTSPYIVNGAPVPFNPLPGNSGWIELNTEKDGTLIAALNDAAKAQKGGIVKVSQQELELKKKARASLPSEPNLRSAALRLMPRDVPKSQRAEPVAEVKSALTPAVTDELADILQHESKAPAKGPFKPATQKLKPNPATPGGG